MTDDERVNGTEGLGKASWGLKQSRPRPPNVPLLRALWSASDGIWGVSKGSWGVLGDPATARVSYKLALGPR